MVQTYPELHHAKGLQRGLVQEELFGGAPWTKQEGRQQWDGMLTSISFVLLAAWKTCKKEKGI